MIARLRGKPVANSREGLILDLGARAMGNERTVFYERYHHFLLHGLFGALVVTALLTAFARDRMRVALLSLAVFHLHLLCDLRDESDRWLVLFVRDAIEGGHSWADVGGWLGISRQAAHERYSPLILDLARHASQDDQRP